MIPTPSPTPTKSEKELREKVEELVRGGMPIDVPVNCVTNQNIMIQDILSLLASERAALVEKVSGEVPLLDCYYIKEPDHPDACHKISTLSSKGKCRHCNLNEFRSKVLSVLRGE